MTKTEFDKMTFEEALEFAYENSLMDITHEEILLEFAKSKIDDDNIYMALHVLNAVYNNEYDTTYYQYDYSMGTLETPTPLTCKEDLETYIDFEDEE